MKRIIRKKIVLNAKIFRAAFIMAGLIFSQAPVMAYISQESSNESSYAKGEIIVKYKSKGRYAVTESVQKMLSLNEPLEQATADHSGSLDELNQQLQVSSARRLFVKQKNSSVAAAQGTQDMRIDSVKNKFPERTQRAPQGAVIPDFANVYVLTVPKGTNIEAACARYQEDPHVEYAQPNYRMKAYMVPNDTYYGSSNSWGQGYDDLWGLMTGKMDMEPAWDFTKGDGVIVAVVDTGLDYNHPDIQGNVWTNSGETPGNGIDDDNNGYKDDVKGWDFSNNDNDPMDGNGHGTHCSGTIAAKGNNGIGIIGVAPKAKIMGLKALYDNGGGFSADLAEAIVYATENGADVISNSWGCNSGCPSDPVTEDAVRNATALGAVVVFASGNSDDDVKFYSPQNMAETFTVGASSHTDERASFSNYGMLLDVVAPGGDSGDMSSTSSGNHFYVNILSLRASGTDMYEGAPNYTPGEFVVNSNYYRSRGTSMACPHAAGLAALIVAKYPDFSLKEIKSIMRHSADDIGGGGFDQETGYGRINANEALKVDSPCVAEISFPGVEFYASKGNVKIRGIASCRGGFANYKLEVGEGETPSSWSTITTGTSQVNGGELGTWNITDHPDRQPVALRLTVKNYDGDEYVAIRIGKIFRVVHEGWPKKGVLPTYPASGDLNNDGIDDLVFTDYDMLKTWAVRHDGTTLPGWPIDWVKKTNWYGGIPTLGDLAGESTPEVIVAGRNKVYAFYADGSNVPGWPVNIKPPEADYFIANWTTLTCADFDGDGKNEVALMASGPIDEFDWISKLFLIDSDGTIMPNWPRNNASGSNVLYDGVTAADMTGDGVPEIIVRDWLVFEIFNYQAEKLWTWYVPVLSSYSPTALGDLTGDGVPEIVFSSDFGIYAYEHDGTLVPGWPFERNTGGHFFREMNGPVIADIDLDGEVEVIAVLSEASSNFGDKSLAVIKSNGTYFPGWPVEFDDKSYYPKQSPVIGDADGDGKPDIIVSTKEKIYAFNAQGNILSGWPYPFPGNGMILGDFDGDQKLELVTDGFTTQSSFMIDLNGPAAPDTLQWPMLLHDSRRTGLFGEQSGPEVPPVLKYNPVEPCRIVDTRNSGGAIPPGGLRSYNVRGAVTSQGGNPAGCPSPQGEPHAVHLSVTAVPVAGQGHLRLFPFNTPTPNASMLNYSLDAGNMSNAITVKSCYGCTKDVKIQSFGGTTHVVIDVMGYYNAAP